MSKSKLKFIYYSVFMLCNLLGLCLYGLILVASHYYGIYKKSLIANEVIQYSSMGLALWLADGAGKAVCNRFNALSGQQITRTIARSTLRPGTRSLEIEKAAEHRWQMPLWMALPVALFFTALCVGCLFFLPTARTWEEVLIGIIGIGLFGCFGVLSWLLLLQHLVLQHLGINIKWLTNEDTVVARSDENGVTACNGLNVFKKKFVPWSQVDALELTTFYDEVGEVERVRPVLKNPQGRRLLNLNLNYASHEDRDSFVRFLENRLMGQQ